MPFPQTVEEHSEYGFYGGESASSLPSPSPCRACVQETTTSRRIDDWHSLISFHIRRKENPHLTLSLATSLLRKSWTASSCSHSSPYRLFGSGIVRSFFLFSLRTVRIPSSRFRQWTGGDRHSNGRNPLSLRQFNRKPKWRSAVCLLQWKWCVCNWYLETWETRWVSCNLD